MDIENMEIDDIKKMRKQDNDNIKNILKIWSFSFSYIVFLSGFYWLMHVSPYNSGYTILTPVVGAVILMVIIIIFLYEYFFFLVSNHVFYNHIYKILKWIPFIVPIFMFGLTRDATFKRNEILGTNGSFFPKTDTFLTFFLLYDVLLVIFTLMIVSYMFYCFFYEKEKNIDFKKDSAKNLFFITVFISSFLFFSSYSPFYEKIRGNNAVKNFAYYNDTSKEKECINLIDKRTIYLDKNNRAVLNVEKDSDIISYYKCKLKNKD